MRKPLVTLYMMIILAIFVSPALAMKIPEDVKKTVTFIFIKSETNGKLEYWPVGTGFIVGIQKQNSNDTYLYLVTAKHVLFDDNGKLHNSIYIRMNKMFEQSELSEFRLTGSGAVKIFHHPTDKDVDIAVIPIHISVIKGLTLDIKCIPFELITTKAGFKESKIGEGDEMFFVGLFVPYPGQARNYPVVRFGRVALITDERIPWREKRDEPPKMLELYLAEMQSWGGNSGSPVFFYLDPTREPGQIVLGPPKLLLAGVMQGYFQDPREIESIDTAAKQYSLQNVGIAAIVPAYKLYELLESDELKSLRK